MYRERSIDGPGVTLDDWSGNLLLALLLTDNGGNELMRSASERWRCAGHSRAGGNLPPPTEKSWTCATATRSISDGAGREATLYRVALFHVKKGIYHNILSKETRDTAIAITELEKLDIGDFYWTLQAVEIQGGRTITRTSPEVRSRFRITLGESARKPEIKSPRTIYVE
jgi:hypothetical protein